MGVYIKGKRKPDTCYDCDFVDSSDDCFFGLGYTGDMCNYIYEGCPLIEVKTPHGRLIDGDRFYEEFEPNSWSEGMAVSTYIKKASTVIEAEVE